MVAAAGAALEESLARCLPGDSMVDRLELVHDTLRRLAAMVVHERGPAAPRVADANATLATIYPLLQRLVGPFIRLELQLEARGAWVSLLAEELEQIVLNLVVHARDALPLGGTITVASHRRFMVRARHFPHGTLPAGPWTLLEVRDSRATGADRALAQLLEDSPPEPAGSGSLLGLATVRDVVRRAGGLIVAGTAFAASEGAADTRNGVTVCIPEPHGAGDNGGAADGPDAVLVVDGDAWQRTNTAHALRRAGFGVLEADHSGTALELLGGVAGRCVRVIVADGDGVTAESAGFGELLRRCGSRSRLILAVNGPGVPAVAGVEPAAFLIRPYSTDLLVRTVREAIPGAA